MFVSVVGRGFVCKKRQRTKRIRTGFRPRSLATAIAVIALVSGKAVTQGDDCNTNGVTDDQDIAGGTSIDCNSNAIPDECELTDAMLYDASTGPSGPPPFDA